MKTLLREPLLHFLLLGAGLFLVYGHLDGDLDEADPQTIVVDRDKLMSFAQYRSRAFDAVRFNQVIDSLEEEELQRMIQAYVREEALYREAKALQLDSNDYVARSRLIQQLEFIMRGFGDAQVQLTAQEIQRHYEGHKPEYRVKPQVTFTHVFFSRERHGAQKAQALARAELHELNRVQVRFEQAPAHGERFLYHVNYVGREPEEIASHFGREMQEQLFALEPNEKLWRGPFQSSYGAHLVLLTHREAGYVPSLEEVRAQVKQEARQAALERRFEGSVQSLVQAYKVKVKREEFAALRDGPKAPGEGVQDAPSRSTGMSLE